MHCRGMAVPEIAAALKTTNTEVRFYITEHWAEDKEEHEIEMGGSL